MDDILILLLKRGAASRPVRMTTLELGSEIGMSQQNASRRIAQLERGGYVERGKNGMILTKKAQGELAGLYSFMKSVFEGGRIGINGAIVRGAGEGRYYLSLKQYRDQIQEKLGFGPFPGTLNVRVDPEDIWKRQQLLRKEPIIISGFRDNERTYGDLFAYKCTVEGNECAIIIPLRTHHGSDIMEIISRFNIKKKYRKKDGDRIRVVI